MYASPVDFLRSAVSRLKSAARFKKSRRARQGLRRDWGAERLEPRQLLTVTFHGGQLLSSVEAQGVYLGSDWNTNSTLTSQAIALDNYLSYLVQSPYMDMLNQAGY